MVEDNVEATEAWNGPLFEVWIVYLRKKLG